MHHHGQCHCGAIRFALATRRAAGRSLFGWLAALLLGLPAPAAAAEFAFASTAEGARILGADDGFFEAMAPLEMRLRAVRRGRSTREELRVRSAEDAQEALEALSTLVNEKFGLE